MEGSFLNSYFSPALFHKICTLFLFENQVLAFCDGTNFSIMPPAQDNKRLKKNDEGPNTGGMGAVCPYHLSSDDMRFIETNVFEKAMSEMRSRGHPFKGM